MRINFGLRLAPLDRKHLATIRAWRNDYRIWRWCRQDDLLSEVHHEAWYERQAKDPATRMYLVVCGVDQWSEPVGVCGLTSIDWLNRRAEFSLYVAPEHHGKGMGREALKVLLAHGFQNLGLSQIWGETLDQNPAIKTFEALGFRHDGTRRAFYFKDGALRDARLYSLLREEWLDHLARADRPSADGPVDCRPGMPLDGETGDAGGAAASPADLAASEPAGQAEAGLDQRGGALAPGEGG